MREYLRSVILFVTLQVSGGKDSFFVRYDHLIYKKKTARATKEAEAVI